MYDVILVGTDGSEKAQQAVERALELAAEYDAKLHAVTVINTARYGEPALSSHELVLNELEDRGNKQLETIEEMASQKGVGVVTRCFHGDPNEEIIQYAREQDADLIVLGSHGHTNPRAVIGSTVDRVVHGSNRDVLVV